MIRSKSYTAGDGLARGLFCLQYQQYRQEEWMEDHGKEVVDSVFSSDRRTVCESKEETPSVAILYELRSS